MTTPQANSYFSLIRNQFGLLAIGFIALFTGNLGQSFFIGLFQSDIANSLNLSAGEFGAVYAALTMISGFLVLHYGQKLDWIAPRRYALLVLTALLTGVILLTTSPWLIPAVIGLGLVRLCGQGLMTHFGSTLAGREFTVNRGRALGLVSLGMPLGEIILAPVIALLIGWLSWQQIWWAVAAIIFLIWIVLLFMAPWPEAPEIKRDSSGNQIKGPNPLLEKRFWLIIPLTMALPVTLTGIFIFQAQMTLDLNATTTTYALGLTAMGVARFPGALLGGRWIDELGVSLLARIYLMPFALAIILAVIVGGNAGVLILMIGAGISLGMSSPVVDSLLVVLWGREHLGRVRSVKSALMVFSTGLAPAVLGFLIDGGVQFEVILLGMLTFMILGWLLALSPIREAQKQV
ncbi:MULTISPECIES: MFS transporter [unclassified Methylophaga]|jgi:predicted MFS family arabinose efflux permease|uniref:MFS transporter n=1 Tax=unclassified Methylophaga TaxID=2629249 RepID=UPI000C8B8E3B|nr:MULTISPECIES: MFS transporter [unclassified Methylophaga]MAK67113.1 MFS transporter [Methylophaga sp.]MAY18151.1 MFS transporter [Methylophaga sp.]MBN45574.1 MFS transporter [Methylophaga sp.]HCD06365.1 MFS transporter [Methylophaga sp.]|tara:strand:- start:54756 stop:55967 length:1212 start_codon:yes stop_codon:yes gene_type:complete